MRFCIQYIKIIKLEGERNYNWREWTGESPKFWFGDTFNKKLLYLFICLFQRRAQLEAFKRNYAMIQRERERGRVDKKCLKSYRGEIWIRQELIPKHESTVYEKWSDKRWKPAEQKKPIGLMSASRETDSRNNTRSIENAVMKNEVIGLSGKFVAMHIKKL